MFLKNRYSIIAALVLIILIGGGLRFYNLGKTAFDRDEFFELNSSYGYFKTGSFVAWDFNNERPFLADLQDDSSNERAEVFRWQLAQLYRFHEPTEFLTRSLGAAWGVIGIILVYLVTVSLTGNRYIALIAALLTAVGESEIIYSRRLRMYAMFFPIYLAFSWTVYKFYESKYKGKFALFKKIQEKTSFNFSYFLLMLAAGLISYNVHMLTLNIAVTLLAYSLILFLLAVKKGDYINKYSITLAGSFIGYIALHSPILYNYYHSMKKNIRFFTSNYDFSKQYFSDWIYPLAGVALVIFGTWFLFYKMKIKKGTLFLLLSGLIPMLLAVFIWKREESHRYIYFLQSFGIILSAAGIYGVIYLTAARIKKYKILAVIILFAGFMSLVNYDYIFSKSMGVYTAPKDSYYPDFRAVHNYINENMKPGEAMITRAYRGFYWRGQKIKVYDIKSLSFGASGCDQKIDKIVKENPSGWVVYPKVDKLNVCSAGRDYYQNNLARIKAEAIPSSVEIYRWQTGK